MHWTYGLANSRILLICLLRFVTAGLDSEIDLETLEITKEWAKHMQGISPINLITFELLAMDEFQFFEILSEAPSTISGAWFLSTSDSKDIDFNIYDPVQTVVFSKNSINEAIFSFESKRQGMYTFEFKNNKLLQGYAVTFALNCGNYSEGVLKFEDLSPVENKLEWVNKDIKDFQADSQFAQLRQESFFNTAAEANWNLLCLSVIESIGVIAVTVWQVYYLKKLLDNRRSL